MLMTPFPPGGYAGFPAGARPYHGAAGEWQELLRQSSVGDGSIPLGARFFGASAPGARWAAASPATRAACTG